MKKELFKVAWYLEIIVTSQHLRRIEYYKTEKKKLKQVPEN